MRFLGRGKERPLSQVRNQILEGFCVSGKYGVLGRKKDRS